VLAEALFRLNEPAAAEHLVDDLLRLDAKSPRGLWLKGILVRERKGENHAKFFLWAAQSPQAGPEIWVRYATELAATGKLDQAEEYYRKSLKGESWNVPALGGLGELLIHKGQFDEAGKLLAEAVRLDKTDRDLWRMYAEAQKNLGQLAQAADSIGKAIAIRRGGAELLLRGEILMLQAGQAQDEPAAALRLAAAQAFASAADFPAARAEGAYKAAKVYYFLEQYAQAMRLIDQARAAAPASADMLEWEKKIEDARFPRPAVSSTRPARLLDVR
jgi:tetratricopeptide (TPR) repeat protein